MSNDFPKYWTEETYDPETGEILDENTTELVPVEENLPEPLTISEQKSIVSSATDISDKSKNMLSSLIEINAIADTLSQIDTEETIEKRKTVVNAWCQAFINSRMVNNVAAETLKAKLLNRLADNIDNLDLSTSAQIYSDLHSVSSVDAQQAMSSIMGAENVSTQSSGINLTINNATSEGASITNNTLNANPQQVGQLKEVASLNASLKSWGQNIPLPKKKED